MTTWIGHGPVRRWRSGFLRVWCRCGMESYPCPTLLAQQRQRDATAAAREWRDEQRQTWGDQ